MYIKATIVAYTFSVQHFKNATIVAYVTLRVKGPLNQYKQTKGYIMITTRYTHA